MARNRPEAIVPFEQINIMINGGFHTFAVSILEIIFKYVIESYLLDLPSYCMNSMFSQALLHGNQSQVLQSIASNSIRLVKLVVHRATGGNGKLPLPMLMPNRLELIFAHRKNCRIEYFSLASSKFIKTAELKRLLRVDF